MKRDGECKYRINDKENIINKCDIFNKYEELDPFTKLSLGVDIFKYKWGKWTSGILGFSLLIIFVLGIISKMIILEIKVEEQNSILIIKNTLDLFEILQQWVGFGLGIVAMLFSIISMYLSFYNLELQKQADYKAREASKDLKNDLLKEIKEEVSKELVKINKEMIEHFGILEKLSKDTQTKLEEYKSRKDNVTEENGAKEFMDLFGDGE